MTETGTKRKRAERQHLRPVWNPVLSKTLIVYEVAPFAGNEQNRRPKFN